MAPSPLRRQRGPTRACRIFSSSAAGRASPSSAFWPPSSPASARPSSSAPSAPRGLGSIAQATYCAARESAIPSAKPRVGDRLGAGRNGLAARCRPHAGSHPSRAGHLRHRKPGGGLGCSYALTSIDSQQPLSVNGRYVVRARAAEQRPDHRRARGPSPPRPGPSNADRSGGRA